MLGVTMRLKAKQMLFAKLLPLLLGYIHALGHEVTLGNTTAPTSTPTSLHPKKLAIDLNLFIAGVYQRSTKAHEKPGVFWESLHPLCRWGGRFKKKDGNHYEMTEKPWR